MVPEELELQDLVEFFRILGHYFLQNYFWDIRIFVAIILKCLLSSFCIITLPDM